MCQDKEKEECIREGKKKKAGRIGQEFNLKAQTVALTFPRHSA